MSVDKICEQCGEEFKVYLSLKDKSRFCSVKCKCKWMSENTRGEKSPKYKPRIKLICEQCGGEFEACQSRMDRTRFCSLKCHNEWRSENWCGENNPHWQGGDIVKICAQCGGEYGIEPNQNNRSRFCSKECHNKWMSKNQCGRLHHQWKPKVKIKCEQCGIEFEVKPSESDQRFCSRKCKGKWLSGENSPLWKGGISFEPYCHKFNEAFKESIREKYGRVCFLCHATEEENGKKLCVHHSNYNKDCLCDESECEFVPLCTSCHAKTNFNRDYWESIIMEKLEVTL